MRSNTPLPFGVVVRRACVLELGCMFDRANVPDDVLEAVWLHLIKQNDHISVRLRALCRFGAIHKHTIAHLRRNRRHVATQLVHIDTGLEPMSLVAMLCAMTPSQQWNLRMLTEETTIPIVHISAFSCCAALRLARWTAPRLKIVQCMAFSHCSNLLLWEWTCPLLAHVHYMAFFNCSSLKLTTWVAPKLTCVDNLAFDNCTALTLERWEAPRLAFVRCNAFQGCTALELRSWEAPRLTIIESNAFRGCTALVLPSGLPDSVTYVGWGAFDGCVSLSNVAREQIMKISGRAPVD